MIICKNKFEVFQSLISNSDICVFKQYVQPYIDTSAEKL